MMEPFPPGWGRVRHLLPPLVEAVRLSPLLPPSVCDSGTVRLRRPQGRDASVLGVVCGSGTVRLRPLLPPSVCDSGTVRLRRPLSPSVAAVLVLPRMSGSVRLKCRLPPSVEWLREAEASFLILPRLSGSVRLGHPLLPSDEWLGEAEVPWPCLCMWQPSWLPSGAWRPSWPPSGAWASPWWRRRVSLPSPISGVSPHHQSRPSSSPIHFSMDHN